MTTPKPAPAPEPKQLTTTQKPDEFAGLAREMLITQILQLRDLVTMEREAAKQTEEALREAHDHAQEGLKSARKQEREMREQIALLKQHKCENCGSFTVSVFSEPEPGR